jgi:hypothetical protein
VIDRPWQDVDSTTVAPSDGWLWAMRDDVAGGDEVSYQAFTYVGPPEYPRGWVDGAPTSGRVQSCAFCGASPVAWVHPLDSGLVQYRAYGKGHTLPTFWTLCVRCEGIYETGDDEAAVELMRVYMEGSWETDEDVDETVRKPIAVFSAGRSGRVPPRRLSGALPGRLPAYVCAQRRLPACCLVAVHAAIVQRDSAHQAATLGQPTCDVP